MSREDGRSKTPARVQVFYFPKRRAPSATLARKAPHPEDVETSSGVAELPDAVPEDPFEDFGEGSPADDRSPTLETRAAPEEPFHRPEPTPTDRPGRRLPAQSANELLRQSVRRARAAALPHDTPPQRPALDPGRPRRPVVPTPRARTLPDEVSLPAANALPPSTGQEALEYHRRKLQALTSKSGSGSLADMALFAHTLFARGRIREAQVVFESIVAREPEEAFAYTMLGASYLALGDEARALALFDAALAMDPGDLAALVNRAEIRLRRGQNRPAMQDLEKALGADPAGRDPFSDRARALLMLAKTLVRAER